MKRQEATAGVEVRSGDRRTRRISASKVVLGALLTLAAAGVQPALATHSLTISHTPPSGIKAGTDLILEFRVTGDCEDAEAIHSESVDAGAVARGEDGWMSFSADVPKACDPLESDLVYWNSAGQSRYVYPDSESERDETGARTLTFTIEGTDVTTGTLKYQMSVRQKQRQASVRLRGTWGSLWACFEIGDVPVVSAAETNPHKYHTVTATHDGSVSVSGSGSTSTKSGGGKK